MRRLNVLVSAYACEPHRGSEPGVGWNWTLQIARFHDVWVITRANNRGVIEQALAEHPRPNVRWVYFDLPRWASFWKVGERGVHIYYLLWQIGAYVLARRLHERIGLHIVHHLTFGNYWMPSLLVLLPVPFVWGPLGGGETTPGSFGRTFHWRARAYERVRTMTRWLGERNPIVRLDARRGIALAKAPETAERLRALGARSVHLCAEAGISTADVRGRDAAHPRLGSPFRVLSIGRLLHLKGFHLGLTAFAQMAQRGFPCEYWFVGDGPERGHLEELAQQLGLARQVRFWGSLPRRQVLDALAACQVLVHPSLHDSGGWVCLEAMAAGCPVICLDLGGPALQVTSETGFKVPAREVSQTVAEIAAAMLRLAQDPELQVRMGEAGRSRVRTAYAWDLKGPLVARLYREAVEAPLGPSSLTL